MKKSFSEIFAESISVFKKSAFSLLKICGVCLGGVLLICLTLISIMGKDFVLNMQNSEYMQNYLSTHPMTIVILLLLPVLYICLLVLFNIAFCWAVLVIRNNTLVEKSFLKEAFFEAVRKFWRVFGGMLLIGVICATLALLEFVIPLVVFAQQSKPALGAIIAVILFSVTMILISPSLFTAFYGILCLDGDFWETLKESICLGFRNWFRIMGYIILFAICYMVIFFALTIGIALIFKSINLIALGNIFTMILQLCLMAFSYCFYTIFYLDLAGIRPQQQSTKELSQEQIIQND